jgi:hypothetical protein
MPFFSIEELRMKGCLSETIYLVQSIKSFSKVSSRCVYGILLEQVGLGS